MSTAQQYLIAPTSSFTFVQGHARVLGIIARYCFVQPRHLYLLTGCNERSVRKWLLDLYNAGFLQRLAPPTARPNTTHDGFVYYLTARGVDLARVLGAADEHLRANTEKSLASLHHDLLLSNVHAALELATRDDATLALSFWEQRRALLLDAVEVENPHTRRRERLSINPDGLLSITNHHAPQELSTAHFFIEIERSRQHSYEQLELSRGVRVSESALLRKARTYEMWYRAGGHTESWGITNFRVLFLLKTEERVTNFCKKLREYELPFKRFWVASIAHVSLDEPQRVLESIFVTPRNFEARRYALIDCWNTPSPEPAVPTQSELPLLT